MTIGQAFPQQHSSQSADTYTLLREMNFAVQILDRPLFNSKEQSKVERLPAIRGVCRALRPQEYEITS